MKRDSVDQRDKRKSRRHTDNRFARTLSEDVFHQTFIADGPEDSLRRRRHPDYRAA